jgi:hypothetical protein
MVGFLTFQNMTLRFVYIDNREQFNLLACKQFNKIYLLVLISDLIHTQSCRNDHLHS